MIRRYDIVLVAFPFTDGPAAKPRPALVITTSERHGDALLAFISSNVGSQPERDELDIPSNHPDFAISGLGPLSCQQGGRWGDLSSKHVSKMAFS
jgi:hypothetical protein